VKRERGALRSVRTVVAGLGVGGALLGGGCGDPLLPSDYAGPPAGAVAGNVLDKRGLLSKDVTRPGLSVEWLPDAPAAADPPLVAQAVAYSRSMQLDHDWEIGLELPSAGTGLQEVPTGRPEVRFSVGKMVYFDDRVPDGRFDWTCSGSACDALKAVSQEFVVFVDVPPTCARDGRALVAAGYHYYRLIGGTVTELGADDAMTFELSTTPLGEADLTSELRTFTTALVASWSLAALGGC
jgi:hypothetical protein